MKNVKKKDTCNDCAMLVARLSIALLFAGSLFGKLSDFSGTASFIGSKYPVPEFLLVAAIAMLIVGLVSVVLGYKMCIGAGSLLLFTLLATVMFHIGEGQAQALLKNLAIAGGLILLMKADPGRFSYKG